MTDDETYTETAELPIRECDLCGHEAVVLDGQGTECIECANGTYQTVVGVDKQELTVEQMNVLDAEYDIRYV